MPHRTAPVVIEVSADCHDVIAVVTAGEPADDVLRRGIKEAVLRSGGLVVIQLVDDPSAVRRGLAKAMLARDLAWWVWEVGGVTATVETMADSCLDDVVGQVAGAACVVASASTIASRYGLAVLTRAPVGVADGVG